MKPGLLDYGFVQRGASSVRVDRPGGRWRFVFGFPPMKPDVADTFTARLTRAKRQGLEIDIPRLVDQGNPGAPAVAGAGQSGTTLNVDGLNAGYIAREGFWLTIVDADGVAYVHRMVETVVAASDGTAAFEIEPPLREPFLDGATIEMRKPFVQGFMDGDVFEYDVPSDQFIVLGVTVEEYR